MSRRKKTGKTKKNKKDKAGAKGKKEAAITPSSVASVAVSTETPAPPSPPSSSDPSRSLSPSSPKGLLPTTINNALTPPPLPSTETSDVFSSTVAAAPPSLLPPSDQTPSTISIPSSASTPPPSSLDSSQLLPSTAVPGVPPRAPPSPPSPPRTLPLPPTPTPTPPPSPPPELSFSPSDDLRYNFHLWIELSRSFTADGKILTETLDNQVWTLAELLATAGLYTRTAVLTPINRYKEKNEGANLIEFVIDFDTDEYGFKNTNSLRLFVAKKPSHRKVSAQVMAELVRLQLITSPEGQLLAPHIRKIGFSSRHEVTSLIAKMQSRLRDNGATVFHSKFIFTTIEADKVNSPPTDTGASSNKVASRKSWEELFPRKWAREAVANSWNVSANAFGESFIFTVKSMDLSNVAGLA